MRLAAARRRVPGMVSSGGLCFKGPTGIWSGLAQTCGDELRLSLLRLALRLSAAARVTSSVVCASGCYVLPYKPSTQSKTTHKCPYVHVQAGPEALVSQNLLLSRKAVTSAQFRDNGVRHESTAGAVGPC